MAEDHSEIRMTAFDCEVERNAFRKPVVERRISEGSRPQYAGLASLNAIVEAYCKENGIDPTSDERRQEVALLVILALELTELDEIDTDILDRITR